MSNDATNRKSGKIIVVSAPSGCGKSTIINSILDSGDPELRFSVSATNRHPRKGEVDGVHYHFMTTEEFRDAIAADEFIEWEEVYPGRFYGTLKSEIERIVDKGGNVILDIDVKGGLNVKKQYGDKAKTIFFLPPTIEELRHRLENRGTDSKEVIDERVSKAEYEISFSDRFDKRIVNDNLDKAIEQTRETIKDFINS
ncbi:MAG: guanylate kinase [Muribaculaceae bacterium]|nr:guanylate kinase [Muribaculaceae bacterium]